MLKYILTILLGVIAIVTSVVWAGTDGFGYDYEKHGIILTRIITTIMFPVLFFVGFSCVIIGAASNERYHADKAEIQYQKIADGDYEILSILPHRPWLGDIDIKSNYGTIYYKIPSSDLIFKSDIAADFSASAKKLSVKRSERELSLVVPYSYIKQEVPGISNAITRDIAPDDD